MCETGVGTCEKVYVTLSNSEHEFLSPTSVLWVQGRYYKSYTPIQAHCMCETGVGTCEKVYVTLSNSEQEFLSPTSVLWVQGRYYKSYTPIQAHCMCDRSVNKFFTEASINSSYHFFPALSILPYSPI